MPTNEQRREVAQRLRFCDCHDDITEVLVWVLMVYGFEFNEASNVIKLGMYYPALYPGKEFLGWLADLIEPEPEPEQIECTLEATTGSWQCPRCGGVWSVVPTYCPCCGKRV